MAISQTGASLNPISPVVPKTQNNLQYGRNFSLIVFDNALNGVDLSALRCKFSIKRSSNQTPNTAEIRVYNLSASTANDLQSSLSPYVTDGLLASTRGQVILQGGYNTNPGVVFKGNIKQIILGRESAQDTFVDLICGDGDFAYNYAVVNSAIAARSSQSAQFGQIMNPMNVFGVQAGGTQPPFNSVLMPRGKTYWGSAKDYLRVFAASNGQTWSIQNEQVNFIPQQGYAQGQSIVLTSKTGMVGTPEQTSLGVNVVCLMNPLINPGRTIKIDNASVAKLKIDLGNPNDPANTAPPLTADGVYYVLIVEQTGDTRGVDWYSKLICNTVSVAGNPANSVSGTYGP